MTTARALVALDLPIDPADIDAIAAAALIGGWEPVLAHVVEPVPIVSGGGFGTYVPPVEPDLGPIEEELASAGEQLGERGVTVVGQHVVVGSPIERIMRLADETAADMIVAVSRTHNLLHRIVLGSVLSALLKATDRPMLVLPKGGQGPGLSAALDRLFDAADRSGEEVDLADVRAAAAAHRSDPENEEPKRDLQTAMQRLEVEHPALAKAANDVGYYLSGLGI